MSIADDIAAVRLRIEAAARRAHRSPGEVKLMAVTKKVAAERIREAYAAGIRLFGENRVQEFTEKMENLRDLQGAEWHLIGHLQSNKSAQAVKAFDAVDSVDSLRLAEKLNGEAQRQGKKLPVLLEIKLADEPSKSGLATESQELAELLAAGARLRNLDFRGLMAIPPWSKDAEAARPYFRQLREASDRFAAQKLEALSMDELSMGMSHDFEVAIEEGATCVRVGTAIFGERP